MQLAPTITALANCAMCFEHLAALCTIKTVDKEASDGKDKIVLRYT